MIWLFDFEAWINQIIFRKETYLEIYYLEVIWGWMISKIQKVYKRKRSEKRIT